MIYFTEDLYHITTKKFEKKNGIHIGTYICLNIRKKKYIFLFLLIVQVVASGAVTKKTN